jgi:peptide/nickel transport system substrate-binding protein
VWDNPDAQKMLRESMLTFDKDKRQSLFDEMHRRFIADVPMIVLFNGSELAATGKNVVGFAGWPYGEPRFWGVSLQ